MIETLMARIADRPLVRGLRLRLEAHYARSMPTSKLIQTWRLVRVALHLLLGMLEVLALFRFYTLAQRTKAIGNWSKTLLHLFNIRVRVVGTPPGHYPANTVLVANHISWLDIFAINAITVSRFVAKAEVRHWPLIGWLSTNTGTLFISREKRQDTVKVNQAISVALSAGDCIAVFPEGSTTDGRTLKPFNSSLLQPAVDAEAALVAVGVQYLNRHGGYSNAAAYVDDMSLMNSIMRLVATRELIVQLTFFPALVAAGKSRRELTKSAEALILSVVNPAQGALADRTAPETADHLPDEAP